MKEKERIENFFFRKVYSNLIVCVYWIFIIVFFNFNIVVGHEKAFFQWIENYAPRNNRKWISPGTSLFQFAQAIVTKYWKILHYWSRLSKWFMIFISFVDCLRVSISFSGNKKNRNCCFSSRITSKEARKRTWGEHNSPIILSLRSLMY